jgi:hypothetical protein
MGPPKNVTIILKWVLQKICQNNIKVGPPKCCDFWRTVIELEVGITLKGKIMWIQKCSQLIAF